MITLKDKLQCDICGRPAVGEALVEGARMLVCPNCSRYGRILSAPRAARPVQAGGGGTRPAPQAPKDLNLADNYGEIIKKAREAHGLSLKDLGQKLGIREQELLHMEEGKLRPPEKDCRKLEIFLKIKLLVAAEKEDEEETLDDLAKKLEQMKRHGKGSGPVTLADMVEIKVKKN